MAGNTNPKPKRPAPISIRLEPELAMRLENASKKAGQSRNAIIVAAINEHLNGERPALDETKVAAVRFAIGLFLNWFRILSKPNPSDQLTSEFHRTGARCRWEEVSIAIDELIESGR